MADRIPTLPGAPLNVIESKIDPTSARFEKNMRAMAELVSDESVDLMTPFAHGDGQNLLREALVLAAHNSYHLGQLVFLKKLLLDKHGK